MGDGRDASANDSNHYRVTGWTHGGVLRSAGSHVEVLVVASAGGNPADIRCQHR